MNLTIHVQGTGHNRNTVRFSLTRNGLPEDVLTRQELRSLAKTLSGEMPLLANVLQGSDITVEVGVQEHVFAGQQSGRARG